MEGKPAEHDPATVADGLADKVTSAEDTPAPAQGTVAPAAPVPAAAEEAPGPAASALPAEEDEALRAEIIAALKTVYDPEIPADIYELGLIYDIAIDADRNVAITMTLTAPGCPVAGEMPHWVENAVNAVPGVANAAVAMTFDPPWDMGRMSDEARLALNMF